MVHIVADRSRDAASEAAKERKGPQYRLKLLLREEIRAPCTALGDINGHLFACLGNKALIYAFEDNTTLSPSAFIDLHVYCTAVKCIKNFAIVSDIRRSAYLLAFQVLFFLVHRNNQT